MLYTEVALKTGADLWYLQLDGRAGEDLKPVPFLQTEFDETFGQISPDGRWIVYVSNESGDHEVYDRDDGGVDGRHAASERAKSSA